MLTVFITKVSVSLKQQFMIYDKIKVPAKTAEYSATYKITDEYSDHKQ